MKSFFNKLNDWNKNRLEEKAKKLEKAKKTKEQEKKGNKNIEDFKSKLKNIENTKKDILNINKLYLDALDKSIEDYENSMPSTKDKFFFRLSKQVET